MGTIGHHPLPDPDMDDANFTDSEGNIRRADFGRYVNQLGTLLGNLGFTDLPQAPGFSVIPWAVYRTIGVPSGVPHEEGAPRSVNRPVRKTPPHRKFPDEAAATVT